MENQKELVLFETSDKSLSLSVPFDRETVWLNRHQMAVLFDRDIKTIGKHINNALAEELSDDISVVANFATTAADGKTYKVDYYSLDVIISVGYRVKSKRGTEFRKWANTVLKSYILKGYATNEHRLALCKRQKTNRRQHSCCPDNYDCRKQNAGKRNDDKSGDEFSGIKVSCRFRGFTQIFWYCFYPVGMDKRSGCN